LGGLWLDVGEVGEVGCGCCVVLGHGVFPPLRLLLCVRVHFGILLSISMHVY
jgi:hypothetical protein